MVLCGFISIALFSYNFMDSVLISNFTLDDLRFLYLLLMIFLVYILSETKRSDSEGSE